MFNLFENEFDNLRKLSAETAKNLRANQPKWRTEKRQNIDLSQVEWLQTDYVDNAVKYTIVPGYHYVKVNLLSDSKTIQITRVAKNGYMGHETETLSITVPFINLNTFWKETDDYDNEIAFGFEYDQKLINSTYAIKCCECLETIAYSKTNLETVPLLICQKCLIKNNS